MRVGFIYLLFNSIQLCIVLKGELGQGERGRGH
jgi:hypothetical protein